MKNLSLIFLILFTTQMMNAQNQDPKYMDVFGYGAILASGKGYPAYATYDASQFDVKDKIFRIQSGESSTLDLRVIYPKGTTCGTLLEKLKTEKPEGMANHSKDYDCWKIWCSTDHMGENQVTAAHPWPSKLSDEPSWSEPIIEKFFDANESNSSWSTCGLKWEDIKYEIQDYLQTASAGTKFYVTYGLAYEYNVQGGQVETKWNSDLNIWEQVVSSGGIGYVYSSPIASCTIEIIDDPAVANRFIDNGDGTITDKNSGLMWQKSPDATLVTWEEAIAAADKLSLAGHSDWRLPTADELQAMSEIKWKNGQNHPNPYEWLNARGFSSVPASLVWTSESENGDATSFWAKDVNMQYGGVGSDRKSFTACAAWAVRSTK